MVPMADQVEQLSGDLDPDVVVLAACFETQPGLAGRRTAVCEHAAGGAGTQMRRSKSPIRSRRTRPHDVLSTPGIVPIMDHRAKAGPAIAVAEGPNFSERGQCQAHVAQRKAATSSSRHGNCQSGGKRHERQQQRPRRWRLVHLHAEVGRAPPSASRPASHGRVQPRGLCAPSCRVSSDSSPATSSSDRRGSRHRHDEPEHGEAGLPPPRCIFSSIMVGTMPAISRFIDRSSGMNAWLSERE